MVTMTAKKPTRRGAPAPTSPPSSSSVSSCSWGSSVVPRGHISKNKKKKERARSGQSNAAVVPAARGTSIYRGVSRHKASGKYEVYLWDRHCRSPAQSRRGKQVYLGAYNTQEAAARAYDLAALKCWGSDCCCVLNFPADTYTQERETMQHVTRDEYLSRLKRESSGFTRGESKFRGVARHHTSRHSRWEARISYPTTSIKKYLYLGTFDTQEDAARAYDMAAIRFRGLGAVTNFDIDSYVRDHLQPPLCKSLMLLPKIEPTDEPLLRDDVDDVERAVAEVLQALCVDRADFDARYPSRRAPGWWCWPSDDDVRDLPADVGFQDDIESVEFGSWSF